MRYQLAFLPSALKEWRKLDATLQRQFRSKLAERLELPHIPAAAIRGGEHLYKIKLRQAGYRLVYHVVDETVTVTVVAVGKREQQRMYQAALNA